MIRIDQYVREKLNIFAELLYIESDNNVFEWGVVNSVLMINEKSQYFLDPYNINIFHEIRDSVLLYRQNSDEILLRAAIRNSLVLYIREMTAERFAIISRCITLEEWKSLIEADTSILYDEQFLMESERISL